MSMAKPLSADKYQYCLRMKGLYFLFSFVQDIQGFTPRMSFEHLGFWCWLSPESDILSIPGMLLYIHTLPGKRMSWSWGKGRCFWCLNVARMAGSKGHRCIPARSGFSLVIMWHPSQGMALNKWFTKFQTEKLCSPPWRSACPDSFSRYNCQLHSQHLKKKNPYLCLLRSLLTLKCLAYFSHGYMWNCRFPRINALGFKLFALSNM